MLRKPASLMECDTASGENKRLLCIHYASLLIQECLFFFFFWSLKFQTVKFLRGVDDTVTLETAVVSTAVVSRSKERPS